MIEEAEALLFQASRMGAIGRYQLEAAVQSAHVVRRLTGKTDWAAIERLYDALSDIIDSPVVAINRAIAIAETRGPAAGLAALDALATDTRLADYQPYWAARAGLLARTGERAAAEATMSERRARSRPGGAGLPAAPPRPAVRAIGFRSEIFPHYCDVGASLVGAKPW